MKFLIIHNPYSKIGGEDSVVRAQTAALHGAGHEVVLYERAYAEIEQWRWGRVASFFSALYNRRSVREVRALVALEKPDVALIHNLFPVVSPAVLPVLHHAGVRVVMTLHNYRLACPTGVMFRDGRICEECATSRSCREWRCLAHRCEGSFLGSFAYALRSFWARRRGYYTRNVDRFLALSDFQRDKLLSYNILRAESVGVLANPVDFDSEIKNRVERENFIGFVGRLSIEKGAPLLLETARRLPDVEFRVVGYSSDYDGVWGAIPDNIKLLGTMNRDELSVFYRSARAVLSTSVCYETFGLTIAEGMAAGAVGIVPRLASMADLVDQGRAGLTYEAGSADELSAQIERLLADNALAADLAKKGEQYAKAHYSTSQYLSGLFAQIAQI